MPLARLNELGRAANGGLIIAASQKPLVVDQVLKAFLPGFAGVQPEKTAFGAEALLPPGFVAFGRQAEEAAFRGEGENGDLLDAADAGQEGGAFVQAFQEENDQVAALFGAGQGVLGMAQEGRFQDGDAGRAAVEGRVRRGGRFARAGRSDLGRA